MLTSNHPELKRAVAVTLLIAGLWGAWFLFLRPEEPGRATVPTDLLGRWESSDHRYIDRFFLIRPDTVVWGQGETQLTERLWAVETEETEGHPIVVLVSGEEFGSARRSPFFYDRIDSLFPVNRREVRWSKVEPKERP